MPPAHKAITITSRAVATSAKMLNEQSSMRGSRDPSYEVTLISRRASRTLPVETPPIGAGPPRPSSFLACDLTFARHRCQHEQGLIFYRVRGSTYHEATQEGDQRAVIPHDAPQQGDGPPLVCVRHSAKFVVHTALRMMVREP